MSLSSTILGYPRIGRRRELKRALEAYWAGSIDETALVSAEAEIRRANLARMTALGLDSLPENSSLYDQVLDITYLLGAVPERLAGLSGLPLYFALARGHADTPPLEMTKWFDTNYHYLVPEIGSSTPISFAARDLVDRAVSAKQWGYETRPVLVGPVTYLALSKPAGPNDSPKDRLADVVTVYGELLAAFAEESVEWVQFDEPALVSDNLAAPRSEIIANVEQVWAWLSSLSRRPKILLAAPYGDSAPAFPALVRTGVEALAVDLDRGTLPNPEDLPADVLSSLPDMTIVAGVVDGRNVWRTDYANAASRLDDVRRLGARIVVGTTTSLQHIPHDTALESWNDGEHADLHDWLAFADQKIVDVVTLDRGLREGWDSIGAELEANAESLRRRESARGVVDPAVRSRLSQLTDADRSRGEWPARQAAQEARLGLPHLPTTTIGSFPQTDDIRQARAAFARGDIDLAAYEGRMAEEIEATIRLQEDLGLDVLVHGEAERNDMVQYFGELLEGFAVTRHG